MTQSRILGDYSIIKQLGQGSLGSVFLAEQRFIKRQYLIKVLPEELAEDRSFISRLEEDVSQLAHFDHPNIVKIHHVSYANGKYFLVVDCVVDERGETSTLAQYLQSLSKSLKEEEIWDLLHQVASALDYGHAKGLAHRGVKLNNILVGKGAQGKVQLYLTDYGLSRIIGSGAVLTRIYKNVADALNIGGGSLYGGSLFGASTEPDQYPNPPVENQKLIPLHAIFLQNYLFLAPEQRRLEIRKPAGIKVDHYAFGILAYYLLAGEFPEGYFEFPSGNKWNWQPLLQSCLSNDPAKRPDGLVAALEAVKAQLPRKSESELVDAGTTTNSTAEQLLERTAPLMAAPVPVMAAAPVEAVRPVIKTPEIERPVHDPDPAKAFQIDHSVKSYTPEKRELRDIEPIRSEMTIIPEGTYLRGSNDGNRDEMPQHRVHLDGFAIDVHPVTNEQFVRFLEVMGGEKDSNHLDMILLRDSRIKRRSGKLLVESGYVKHPVTGVTWYGASAYAKWVGKRLPTECEWEIAAQGGLDQPLFPTGEDLEKSQANFFSSDTTGVMSYAPNDLGIYDLAGNVYEWCQDWYGYNYYEVAAQEPDNPQGPIQGVYRVLRGGCWKSLKEDLRCSRRHRNNPGTVNGTYGFRCAADVKPNHTAT